MKFTRDEIRRSMLLYAISDRTWLKEGESLADVCRRVLDSGATFLQIREKDLEPGRFAQEAEELQPALPAAERPLCGQRQRGDRPVLRRRRHPCGTVRPQGEGHPRPHRAGPHFRHLRRHSGRS